MEWLEQILMFIEGPEEYNKLYSNDPPWHVIAPVCSDPMGPKTILREHLDQPLPPNIFPKDLMTGWKDDDISR